LKEVFNELDMTSEVLEILLSPDKPFFRLSTFGNAGSTQVRVKQIIAQFFIVVSFITFNIPHTGINRWMSVSQLK